MSRLKDIYDDGLFCVGCGEFMENPRNHHCDPKIEARIERELALKEFLSSQEEVLTPSERMELGFELLHREDEDDA